MPLGRSRYSSNYGRSRRGGSLSLRLIPILLFAGYFAYYYFSNQEVVPLTGRTQLVDMTQQEEMALGVQSYKQILSQSDIVRSGENFDHVQNIGERIAKAASDMGHDPGFQWEFNLIKSDQANAFALSGGKVAIYTGIIPVAKNIDGLAVIMGHEVAHAVARHGAERMAHQKLVQFGTMAAGVAMGDSDFATRRAVMAALGAGGQYGVLLPFSRKHESEADYIGLMYVARACYDPREAPYLWERMAKASGGGPSEFSSTHPSPETRIQQFKEWMPEALEVYRQHCS